MVLERIALKQEVDEKGELKIWEDKKETKMLNKVSRELDKRYKKCDSEGHQKPDKKENICKHCYRTLEIVYPNYGPQLSLNGLPMFNAPALKKADERHKQMVYISDLSRGMKLLEEEMFPNNNS